MKKLIVCILMAILLSFANCQIGNIEKVLDEKLEEFRAVMKTGDPGKGIPVLAPYTSPYQELEMDFAGLLFLDGILKNLVVENLDGFINNKLTFNVITLRSKFNFTFPDVKVRGFEDLWGSVFNLLPIWGYGDFYINPQGVTMWGEARFSLTISGYLKIRSFDVNLILKGLENKIDNLLTGDDLSDLLNVMLPDIIPSAIENFPDEVSKKLNKVMLPFLDYFFSQININDLQ